MADRTNRFTKFFERGFGSNLDGNSDTRRFVDILERTRQRNLENPLLRDDQVSRTNLYNKRSRDVELR